MPLSRCRRAPFLAAALCSLILFFSTPARALTSTSQTFELIFTLTDIIDVGTGQTIDPFLLQDVLVEGQAVPGFIFIDETGNATVTRSRTEFHNGVALGPFDDFVLEIGDTFSTVQVNDTLLTSGIGDAQLFENFSWDIPVENQTFEDLEFVFDWEYTRMMTFVEMGANDDATVFLGDDIVFVEDFEGFELEDALFPDPMIMGNTPLNIGVLPPGLMLTLMDSGQFTLPVNGDPSSSSAISIGWEIGARSNAVPEPSVLVMLAGGLVLALRRRG